MQDMSYERVNMSGRSICFRMNTFGQFFASVTEIRETMLTLFHSVDGRDGNHGV